MTLAQAEARQPDLVALVEASYDVDLPLDAWLERLAALASRLVPEGTATSAYTFDFSTAGDPQFSRFATIGWPDGAGANMSAVMQRMSVMKHAWMERMHIGLPRPVGTLSEHYGDDISQTPTYGVLRSIGGLDAFGCIAAHPEGHGVVIAASLPRKMTLAPAVRQRWSRVATHLAAGHRLRLRGYARDDDHEDDAAVIAPSGSVVHARGATRSMTSRGSLRDAVRAIDRARSRAMRSHPDESLALWQGLVSGTWSLVERFESDGKRFFVARRNDPETAGPLALTRRERQVLAYAAMGHPLKLIAYDLGLSASTVAHHRASGMQKLGLRSAADLAGLFGPPSTVG
ncbi:MAG TPA: LuxR C-terminal-related transcriptional regulator [Polyangiaceae bacterium]